MNTPEFDWRFFLVLVFAMGAASFLGYEIDVWGGFDTGFDLLWEVPGLALFKEGE